jgi:hypothetical protein
VNVDMSEATEGAFAMLHKDAGKSGTYEFPGPDTPVLNSSGDIVMSHFMLWNFQPDATRTQ